MTRISRSDNSTAISGRFVIWVRVAACFSIVILLLFELIFVLETRTSAGRNRPGRLSLSYIEDGRRKKTSNQKDDLREIRPAAGNSSRGDSRLGFQKLVPTAPSDSLCYQRLNDS
jgi:hypothetical protein